MSDSKFVVETLCDVAQHFGLTPSGAGYWRSRGMPGEPGAWDLRLITRWTFTLGPWSSQGARDDTIRHALGLDEQEVDDGDNDDD